MHSGCEVVENAAPVALVIRSAAKAKDVVTLPEYFSKNGYHTVSAGKIFHRHETASGNDDGQWAFQEVAHPGGGNKGILWQESPSSALGEKASKNELAWGACKAPTEETKDYIVRVPGMTPPDLKCQGVVNLLDMYPTLVELCGLPPNAGNEGRSFVPLLKNPKMEWNHPTLTTYQFKNHSLTDGRYRYTCYGGKADGADELYDHSTDPLERQNLASDPDNKEIIARFKKQLPTHDEPDSPRNGPRGDDKKAKHHGGKPNDGE